MFTLPTAAVDFHGNGLAAVAPLVGKTWVGEDVNAAGEKTVRVEQWESIIGGKAVRMTASVNDGELGYPLTFYVDPITHGLSFQGVSSNGAYTQGSVALSNGTMVWKEKVIGSPNLNLVKLTFGLLPDGRMKSSSEYFKNHTVIPGGHEFRYHVATDAKLVFAISPR